MRGTDAASRSNDRPAGVSCRFQVIENSVEPRPATRARNLLSKDDRGSVSLDESVPRGPQVPLVVEALCASGGGPRLAGATTCPDGQSRGPPSESQRVRPDTDPGEGVEGRAAEVRLRRASSISARRCAEIQRGNVLLEHRTTIDVPRVDQIPKPRAAKRIDLVVEHGREKARGLCAPGRRSALIVALGGLINSTGRPSARLVRPPACGCW